MTIYAGIDEAGLGPTLGPYVLGTTVFDVPEVFNLARPGQFDFYSALESIVAPKRVPKAQKVIVNDSKKLHNAGEGLRRLEEALLPFAIVANDMVSLPGSLNEFLSQTATIVDDDLAHYPWYRFGVDGVAATYPLPQGDLLFRDVISRSYTARHEAAEAPRLSCRRHHEHPASLR